MAYAKHSHDPTSACLLPAQAQAALNINTGTAHQYHKGFFQLLCSCLCRHVKCCSVAVCLLCMHAAACADSNTALRTPADLVALFKVFLEVHHVLMVEATQDVNLFENVLPVCRTCWQQDESTYRDYWQCQHARYSNRGIPCSCVVLLLQAMRCRLACRRC